MKLGYYVKRTDTGRRGYFPAWWTHRPEFRSSHFPPRTDGLALVWWADDGLPSLINVKYLTDMFDGAR